ncbi:MAG: DUF5058 family protein [Lachnospiraceae bacterium]|nr:DUF5058 family protein [Lachnospiraceae bacterium]
MLQQLNSPVIYLICGGIVLFVAVICIVFAVRAYRAGKAIGMDTAKMKRTIIASATFAVLPSTGILLGVIALSGSLGTPWPWLRLSVIGALHYETQVAEAAAEATGAGKLSASTMTATTFSTIALLMSVCIMWGMIMAVIDCKSYNRRLFKSQRKNEAKSAEELKQEAEANAKKGGKKKLNLAGFGDIAMTAMFIGLVSAYIGSYIGTIISGNGLFTFTGDWLPLAVAVVGAAAMGVFLLLKKRFKADWIDSFSLAGSMLIAMGAAVFMAKL